jgi:DNA-binding transcriptional LysR family regulator
MHAGAGHTGGDTIVWVPSQRVLFSGDLVEYEAGIYMGAAHLEVGPQTMEKLRSLKRDEARAHHAGRLRSCESATHCLEKSKGDPFWGPPLRRPVPEEEEEATGCCDATVAALNSGGKTRPAFQNSVAYNAKVADAFNEMSVFAKVVAAGSLSAAARDLGLSTAMVSRRLAALESRLGVRLVNRTTRSLHLTDEGATYYESCARVLADIEQADTAVSAGRHDPRGTLRVALPAAFGNQYVAPLVPQFAARYPAVQLYLSLADRAVNLIEEGFDVAVRIAELLADSSLAMRKLAPNRRVVCASPEYLRRHGAPRTPEELAQHNCLIAGDFSGSWDYKHADGRSGSVRINGRYACDNWEVLREWAVAGLGVALKSTWDVRRHLENGSLISLLPGYSFDSGVAIYAVYPHRRHLPAKTRAFIDFLASSFGPEPFWDARTPSSGSES